MADSEFKTLASLLVEAETRASRIQDPQIRFERLRLLEGINRYLGERTEFEDKCAVFRCLTGTMGLTEEEVSGVRNEYVASELLSRGKLVGYGSTVDITSLIQPPVPKDWLVASGELLCKQGMLVRTSGDKYITTNRGWDDEIQKLKRKTKEVDSQLRTLMEKRGRRDFDDWGESYKAALAWTLEIGDLLGKLGEKKSSEKLIKKTMDEIHHLGRHHPGPWIPNQVRDHRYFFKNLMQNINQDFRIDSWPNDR